jgi:hypothetical protein
MMSSVCVVLCRYSNLGSGRTKQWIKVSDTGWEVLGHSYCSARDIKTQMDDVRMACVDVTGVTVLTTLYRQNTHVTRPQISVPDSEKHEAPLLPRSFD